MDSTDLVALIKKAATDAVEAGKPANVVFGKVLSASPIQVQLDQQIILGEAQLTVARLLQGYTITVEGEQIEVVPPLAAGERVILAQVSGGQHYIVLDRVGD